MQIRSYSDQDEAAVAAFLSAVFADPQPHNDPLCSIRRKRQFEKSLFLVAVDGTSLIGTVMGGYDGHRGWIYSLAVDPQHRRKGVATALLREIEAALGDLGCPKINLQVLGDNRDVIVFYNKLGYAVEDRVSMGKRLPANP